MNKPQAPLGYCKIQAEKATHKLQLCTLRKAKEEDGKDITVSRLKAVTKEHGLTEYWANRITFCAAHPSYPRVFCWIYRWATCLSLTVSM